MSGRKSQSSRTGSTGSKKKTGSASSKKRSSTSSKERTGSAGSKGKRRASDSSKKQGSTSERISTPPKDQIIILLNEARKFCRDNNLDEYFSSNVLDRAIYNHYEKQGIKYNYHGRSLVAKVAQPFDFEERIDTIKKQLNIPKFTIPEEDFVQAVTEVKEYVDKNQVTESVAKFARGEKNPQGVVTIPTNFLGRPGIIGNARRLRNRTGENVSHNETLSRMLRLRTVRNTKEGGSKPSGSGLRRRSSVTK